MFFSSALILIFSIAFGPIPRLGVLITLSKLTESLELYIKLYYYSKTIAKSVYEESLESIKKRLNNDDC